METINIESSKFLKEQLEQIGFTKKAGWFIRKKGDAIQHLGFLYSTHGEKKTRYYTCTFGFDFNCAKQAAEEMGIILISTGGNSFNVIRERTLFGLKEKKAFREWKIAASYSEEYIKKIIKQIVTELCSYVLPIIDQYAYIDDFLEAIENGTFNSHLLLDRKIPPILYFLHGDDEKLDKYIKQTLDYFNDDNKKGKGLEYIESNQYKEIRYSVPDNNELRKYREFIEKFDIWKNKRWGSRSAGFAIQQP